MEVIKLNKLTKSYGINRGIIDVNLSIEKGDFFGFIGPNGAGKSTTIRTLLGLIKPTTGEATIFGKDIEKDKIEILKMIGYLPSEVTLYKGMKVKDIIKLAADLRKLDCQEEADKLCIRLQLDTSRKIEELSFGNRKKVGIVCALQHKPPLLILDEPTSGLDPLMQKAFFEILKERHQNGTTIFLSSHILSEIEHNCTKAAIIKEGRIIACDLVENLTKTNASRITIQGNFDVSGLEGVKDLKIFEETANFLYSGDINILINKLAKSNIQKLTINEPEFEEIIMHYYTEGGEINDRH